MPPSPIATTDRHPCHIAHEVTNLLVVSCRCNSLRLRQAVCRHRHGDEISAAASTISDAVEAADNNKLQNAYHKCGVDAT